MFPKNYLERAKRFHGRHGTRKTLQEVGRRIALRASHQLERWVPSSRRASFSPTERLRKITVHLLLKVLGPGYKVVAPLRLPRNMAGIRANEVIEHEFRHCRPLGLFHVPAQPVGRINIVTDSISKGSLFGGVATAVILGALAAGERGCRLRIITRTEPAQADSLDPVFAAYGIRLEHDLELAFAPVDGDAHPIEAAPGELFITTSWWTTAAALATLPPKDIVYLLQEDERMFYGNGDEQLRCEQVMRHPAIRFIVNSQLLFEHLVQDGFANIAAQGVWFEPAFPPQVFRRREGGERPLMLFYARPNNSRNLFYLGLDVMDAAVGRRIVDPAVWDVVFVGKDIPPVLLGDGACAPRRLENLDWTAYAELAGRADLALSLMYTPHPSYPPLDLAASGAVVVTNRYGNKTDLGRYSGNVICADTAREPLLAALAEAVALARDSGRRQAGFARNRFNTDWRDAFAQVRSHLQAAG